MTEADQNLNVDTQESFKRYRDRKRVFYDGELIDNRYQVISTGKGAKASGGMGQVYKVKDTEYGHIRAIKLLDAEVQTYEQYEQSVRRFKTETDKIKNNSEIDSEKSIVKVYETCPRPNDKDGNIYFIMDWHEQGNLKSYIEEQRAGQKVSSAEACQMLKDLARALGVLHKHDIIHRDLKPENIMISVIDGEILPVIIDFGIARDLTSDSNLTKDHRMLGTNLWKAPEQFGHLERGGETAHKGDVKTDIFSFGMLGFYLATGGEHPFFTKDELVGEDGLPLSDYVIGKRLLDKETPPRMKVLRKSKLPGWYVDLIERCISRDRDVRPDGFLDVLAYIENEKIPFSFKSIKGKVFAGMVTCVVAALVWFQTFESKELPSSGYLQRATQNLVLDRLFHIRGVEVPPENLALVVFDDESMHRLYPSDSIPDRWSRDDFASAIELVAAAGADRIILDIALIGKREPAIYDYRLENALMLAPTYIARVEEFSRKKDGKIETTYIEPYSLFAASAKDVFLANGIVEGNRVRKFKLGAGTRNGVTPMAEVLYGSDAPKHELPTSRDYINYYGPAGTIKTYSYYEVVSAKSSLTALVANKNVFITVQATVAFADVPRDKFLTSFSETFTPGAEIHATALGNIESGDWIHAMSTKHEVLLNVLLAALLVYVFMVESKKKRWWLMAVVLIVWPLAAYVAFAKYYILISGGLGIVAALVVMIMTELYTPLLRLVKLKH